MFITCFDFRVYYTGINNLNGKLLKILDSDEKDILLRIIGQAYEARIIADDFEKYVIILIPKKEVNEM